jgi:hypothetical protein
MDKANNPEVLAVAGSAIALSGSIVVSYLEEPINTEHNQSWGHHLVKMTIFFDNVFKILPSHQSGKFCIACHSQATFVKLDEDGEPLAFYCDDHVFEARR